MYMVWLLLHVEALVNTHFYMFPVRDAHPGQGGGGDPDQPPSRHHITGEALLYMRRQKSRIAIVARNWLLLGPDGTTLKILYGLA